MQDQARKAVCACGAATVGVKILGDLQKFRNTSTSGRWRDSFFCPACGTTMLTRLEVFPQATGIAVGTFTEATHLSPKKFYWAKRKPAWYSIDAAVPNIEEQ